MIIIELMGGLGNQMFQYATGRKLALERNVELKLDISNFDHDSKRTYRLNHFNTIDAIASGEEIKVLRRYDRPSLSTIPSFLKERLKPYYRRHHVKEQQFEYDPNLRNIGNDAYLSGYWQTEKYFSDIRDILRKEFTLKDRLDEANLELLSRILGKNSVSLHIRRGDYITDHKTFQYHGTCSNEYYQNAIGLVGRNIEDPHFFIFSDDMAWVKRNFPISYPHEFVSHNGEEKDYLDMILMLHCRHHIIANSSFSWWGAWLGESGDATIIAPLQWFRNPSLGNRDLLPESWLRI